MMEQNKILKKYKPTSRMSDLIKEDYRLLQVMSRFGLPLGFSDKCVQEVCSENAVDCHTFLAIANFMQEVDERVHENVEHLSIPSMLNYLKRAHSYYLDFCLPNIKRKLIEAISNTPNKEFTYLILRFFDEYVDEVREHMEFEDKHEFLYVNSLMVGDVEQAKRIAFEVCPMKESFKKNAERMADDNVYLAGERSNILQFTRQQALQHKQIDSKLSELKNIIIKYCPFTDDNHLLNAVLFDIFICEEDLELHCRIEDCLFVPSVRLLEKKNGL